MFVADGGNERDDLNAMGEGQIFFRNGSRSHAADGFSGTASTAAAAGLDAVFFLVGVICVAGAGEHIHCAASIILGSLVFVLHHKAYGGAESDAEFGAGLDLHAIFLVAGGGECTLTGAAAGHLWLDIGFCQLHPWRTAIDYGSHRATMGFTVAWTSQ